LIHQQEQKAKEVLVVELQMRKAGHTEHFKVVNPTPFQIQSPESSLDYDHGKMIKLKLRTLACSRSDVKK
jgi:hypothetical protein